MSVDFQFQPWELILAPEAQNGGAHAMGEWSSHHQTIAVPLREVGQFLFFNLCNGDKEWNFIVSNVHNATSNPPRRAFEKLGRDKTLRLLHRRAIKLGLWGRFFVLNDDRGTKWLIFLGVGGRHLMTTSRESEAGPRREWTPFEWFQIPNLEKTPSSELFALLQAEWQNPASALNRVKSWHEADYFARLWQSLRFDNAAAPIQSILRDAVALIAPDEGARGWILRFQLPEKGDEIDLYDKLFEARGPRQIEITAPVLAKLREFIGGANPQRLRAREADFLAQREWLEGNSGVGNWSLDVLVTPPSAHERLETLLRLKANLSKIWPLERVSNWLAPFLNAPPQ